MESRYRDDLRQDLRDAVARRAKAVAALMARGLGEYELANHLPTEDWGRFSGLSCGARTRAGTPCQQKGLFGNGRCRLHGGMSTGPRTDAGKAISARNGHVPKRTP